MYEAVAAEQVAAALNGVNAAVLCYGQTAAGKTHSFLGPAGVLKMEADRMHQNDEILRIKAEVENSRGDSDDNLLPQTGILLRTVRDLFRAAKALHRQQGISLSIAMQVLEVYEERVACLLSGRGGLRILGGAANGNGVVPGAITQNVHSLREFVELYETAHARQRFAETQMNEVCLTYLNALLLLHDEIKCGCDDRVEVEPSAHFSTLSPYTTASLGTHRVHRGCRRRQYESTQQRAVSGGSRR